MKKEQAVLLLKKEEDSPRQPLLKISNGNGISSVGLGCHFVTLIPASSTASVVLPIRIASGGTKITCRKGKYGKRPASFAVDYGGVNDNSNDSGLDCDNSNSDSQFWGSSEDLRSVGRRRSSSSVQFNGLQRLPIQRSGPNKVFRSISRDPQLLSRLTRVPKDLSSVDLQQPHFVTNIDSSFASVNHGTDGLNDKKVLGIRAASTEHQQKTMSPETMVVDCLPVTVSISTGPHHPRMTPSAVPVKRARFNFQTPAVPLRPASALRMRNQNHPPPLRGNLGKRLPVGTTPATASTGTATSRDGTVQLQILAQPEEQHRARYQTEGSRGAIKDRKGNGFPAVKLVGYDKPATLQIFIGSDQGKISPHMFYQACKVTGKSSTPCNEKKVEGTVFIEIEFEPSKDMVISCDCVGILKERNVDVEQRFPFHHAASSRKKSTRCRLIFRTAIVNSNGITETLQVPSLPILCTQPPGQPEICKKSLSECSCKGGQELFIVGKNFLKDTKVVIQEEAAEGELLWEAKAEMLKDYVQQNHLICVIPPYKDESIRKPVSCKVSVWSGGKLSEPHHLTYLPNDQNGKDQTIQ